MFFNVYCFKSEEQLMSNTPYSLQFRRNSAHGGNFTRVLAIVFSPDLPPASSVHNSASLFKSWKCCRVPLSQHPNSASNFLLHSFSVIFLQWVLLHLTSLFPCFPEYVHFLFFLGNLFKKCFVYN